MVDAMYEIATAEGVFACPEGAATLVALKRLLEQGFLGPEQTIVLLNTGSGYKYLDLIKDEGR
jgi:threonine synthase